METIRDCNGNPINYTDPTGHWGGSIHESITTLAYYKASIIGLYNINTALPQLEAGSTYPDRARKNGKGKFENGAWHGGTGYAGKRDKWMTKAVSAWKKKNYKKAFFNIGTALHTIQDFYAHRVKIDGKYVRIKGDKKTGKPNYSEIDYWSEAFSKKYTGTKKNKYHSITADNIRASFEKNEWVVVKNCITPRIEEAVEASRKYIVNFSKKVKK